MPFTIKVNGTPHSVDVDGAPAPVNGAWARTRILRWVSFDLR